VKRVLTTGGISLAVVLMIGAAAFAGSLGKRVAHDESHSWKHPEVHAVSDVDHPRAFAVKIRANPARPLDWDYKLECYRRHGTRISGEAGSLDQKDPPVVMRLHPTMRHPHDCTLTADATYDTRQHGRLVLSLYAKK
jgi:hypothetical protein